MHQRTLQIVLKVSERCNLNCSYCYYYNMEDETPGARPALLSTRIVEGLIKFLHECAKTAYFDQAVIILHGGETNAHAGSTYAHDAE